MVGCHAHRARNAEVRNCNRHGSFLPLGPMTWIHFTKLLDSVSIPSVSSSLSGLMGGLRAIVREESGFSHKDDEMEEVSKEIDMVR